MRIGLLIDPIDPNLSYKKNIEKASDLGFKVIQLWFRDMVSRSQGHPEEIVELLQKLGLELKSLAAYMDILDPDRDWAAVFGEMKEAIDFAAETHVGYVVTESGGVPGRLEEWDEMIGRFTELVDYAASRNVVLLVENGPGVLVNSGELMVRMISEIDSPNLGINFDPANLVLVPDNVTQAVRALGKHIRDTHAKDAILLHDGSERSVPKKHIFSVPEGEEFIHIPEGVRWVLPPVGDGDVSFPDYLSVLRQEGFDGDLIIEFQGGGHREEAIVRSRSYLEGLLDVQSFK
jgi:sugar phosphate isomerase/epimerase